MAGGDFHADGWRTVLFQPRADDFADVRRLLVRHEAAGDLGPRPRRHNRLAAFALITAGEAVDLKRGPRTALFRGRKTVFAEQLRRTEQLLQARIGKRIALDLVAFVFGPVSY